MISGFRQATSNLDKPNEVERQQQETIAALQEQLYTMESELESAYAEIEALKDQHVLHPNNKSHSTEHLSNHRKNVVHFKLPQTCFLSGDLVGYTYLTVLLGDDLVHRHIIQPLFNKFNVLVQKHKATCFKTVGDGYLVAAKPLRDMKVIAVDMIELALDMMEAVQALNKKLAADLDIAQALKALFEKAETENNLQALQKKLNYSETSNCLEIQIRIGMHIGRCLQTMDRHSLQEDYFGKSFIMAARLEPHAGPGRVLVTKKLYELLKYDYAFEENGTINAKGLGDVITYHLKPFHKRTLQLDIPHATPLRRRNLLKRNHSDSSIPSLLKKRQLF